MARGDLPAVDFRTHDGLVFRPNIDGDDIDAGVCQRFRNVG
jgi:hypothetical protein